MPDIKTLTESDIIAMEAGHDMDDLIAMSDVELYHDGVRVGVLVACAAVVAIAGLATALWGWLS